MAKVFIGVGHGGNDPGAIGNGLKESELNLKQALFLETELKRHGVEVKLSRYKDENDDLNEEIRECNSYNPDLAVDMHTNSGGGIGFEVFHSVYTTGTSYKLASNINYEIVKAGYKSRGAKSRCNSSGGDYYGFIRNTKAPSVITEMAFIDNKDDIKNFDEDYEIKAYSVCIAKGILKTLNIEYKDIEKSESVGELFYRVCLGSYKDKNNAEKVLADAKAKGFNSAFITTFKK